MNAKVIWKNGENKENTWMCFVRHIDLDVAPQSALARIAVDSKYWLYINGETAVFEGGLKRGPSPFDTYYDEVDIAKYLRKGSNTVAVLVWYFGRSGFSHNSSGTGGLMLSADIDGQKLVTDGSWKVKKHPAYVEADDGDIRSNFRLPEMNLYFDASRDLGAWYMPGYNTDEWENADVIKASWGRLVKRGIPQLKNYGQKDYLNTADYEGFVTESDTVLKMKLPYNAQITPYLKITAPAGKRISIKPDRYDDLPDNMKGVMSVYYTREGRQEYEALGWLNGEYMYYTIPAGVTVHSLGYRETGYDTGLAGSFECDDEQLNNLWQKSLRTLYITMRDNFMDCPDRERAQWWGDVNIEMQMMMYCLDHKALLLYKKGVDSLAAWAEHSGSMITVVPSGTEQFELPFQNLAGICGFAVYYDYTGDISVIESAYAMSRAYVLGYEMQDNGLVRHRSGSWDWADWGDNADIAPMENAWYYMALRACAGMAELLGCGGDIPAYRDRMDRIRQSYNRLLWHNGYYYDHTQNNKPDDRANALAVLAGLAEKKKYPKISEILKATENASPYMEKYVLDALCEMGYINEAKERMKKRYREMVEFDYSTLWEYWTKEGTLNHAWSGGPLITMSKYIAGIKPLDPGCSRFEIKPHMCGLSYIKCSVPSVNGDIKSDIRMTESGCVMDVEIPEGTTAEVYLPVSGDDLCKKYILGAGKHHIG